MGVVIAILIFGLVYTAAFSFIEISVLRGRVNDLETQAKIDVHDIRVLQLREQEREIRKN